MSSMPITSLYGVVVANETQQWKQRGYQLVVIQQTFMVFIVSLFKKVAMESQVNTIMHTCELWSSCQRVSPILSF
jgi:hypothetical protein